MLPFQTQLSISMKKSSLLLLIIITWPFLTIAQQTRIFTDPQFSFRQAKEYFQQEQYSLAYPMFRELNESLRETDMSNHRLMYEEVKFYTIVCGLKQNEKNSVQEARSFVDLQINHALAQKMAFHLGEYYFRNGEIRNSIIYYEQTNIANLSNREIADMKFHQGYGYFTLQQFDKARPLLNTIRQMPDDPNYRDANYYYGFIAYRDRSYFEALDAFKKVENDPVYQKTVPFYITTIHYFQGQKDKAIEYAEGMLKKTGSYYDTELRQLLGHAYFEKKEYAKALPYLEAYAGKAEKISREDIYELSYCYYQVKQYNKAIDGFKQLSTGTDSLMQSAMYMLGDAYLKTGQKANARSAFSFCAANNSDDRQREVSKFNYAKLSYELGYQDVALNELQQFVNQYSRSEYSTEARELLVNVLANTNNYKDALALLESLPKSSDVVKKAYPRVMYGRAMELINDQNLAEADRLLDKIIKEPDNTPVLPPTNFWKGEIAYRQDKLDNAIKFYNNYLSGPSYFNGEVNATHARYNLGYCYLRKENYKLAASFFEQVVKIPRLNSGDIEQDAYLRSADCYFMNRDFAKAKGMYNTAINYSWPATDYATYQNAMIAGVTSSNEKLNLLKSFERKFPTSELVNMVNMEIAATYLADEKFKDAIPYLNAVIKGSENSGYLKPRAYLRLGIAHYNLNNNREALNNYKKLVSEYPNSPEAEEALESARAIYVEDGKTGEYVDFLRSAGRSVTRNQEDSITYAAAEVRYTNGDMNNALTAFSNYLQKFPDGEFALDANYFRAEIYNQRKDWRNAIAAYEAVADKGPSKYAEKATSQAAKINYFELQDYIKSEKYFTLLKQLTVNRETRLDAMRGLLRSQYQQKKWGEAFENARELLKEKSTSTDDQVLANLVIAKSQQSQDKFSEAIQSYRSVVNLNKAAFAAEARYETGACYFELNDLKNAEKAAFETINKSGSYDFWITKAYILLGDVFFRQKDYFNAKATLQSVVENSKITELKNEAQEKLNKVVEEEKANSKVDGQ